MTATPPAPDPRAGGATITTPDGREVTIDPSQVVLRRIETLRRVALEAIDREAQTLAGVDAMADSIAQERAAWDAERVDLLAQIARLQAAAAPEPSDGAPAPAEPPMTALPAAGRRREAAADAGATGPEVTTG